MKKYIRFFSIIILLLVFIPSVYAAPTTNDRNLEDNLGVHKKWEVTDYNRENVLKTPYVKTGDVVYDFSEILSEQEESKIRSLANEFTKKYKTDLVILTYNLPYTSDTENEEFAANFYDYNDFGLDLENYSGILLFRNTYSADPYYDMYTFGNAQLYFNSTRYDLILDAIYNDLHKGNYLSGFSSFIEYITGFYERGKPKTMKDLKIGSKGEVIDSYGNMVDTSSILYATKESLPGPFRPNILFMLILGSVVTLVTMLILVKKNKMIVPATQATEYLDKDSFKLTNQNDTLINTIVTHHTIQSSSSGGGGGHSSFGSSGGGHSSGGGRHG